MRFPLSERARHSLKHYLAEVATIIVGILLALTFDGISQRREEQKLAREAALQIEHEMAANKKDLDALLASYPATKQQIGKALQTVGQLIERAEGKVRPDAALEVDYALNLATVGLSTTSLTTAEATGALRHMEYADVRRYADVHSLQQIFTRLHDRLSDHYIATIPVSDPKRLSAPELQALRQSLTAMMQHLKAVEHFGESLSRAYARSIRKR